MLVKYVHDIMKKFDDNFKRNMSFNGTAIRNVYKYAEDVPYLSNKAVVSYTTNMQNATDPTENVVYDYTVLLNAETEDEVLHFEVTTHKISSLSLDQYEEIMRKNTVVAQRMMDLQSQFALLKEIEGI